MNQLIAGIILAVSLATVVGAALGWRYPLRSQSVNQRNFSTQPSRSPTPSPTQPPSPTETASPTPSDSESDASSSVPALW